MNLTEALNALAALYNDDRQMHEDSVFNDRHNIIANIKNTGRNYNFDKWSDAQLYRMWQRIQKEEHDKKIARKILDDAEKARNIKYCSECGTQLSDCGTCPRCDSYYGWEEDLTEDMFDLPSNTNSWISMSTGKQVGVTKTATKQAAGNANKLYYVVSAIPDARNHNSYFYWDFGYELGDIGDLMQHQDVFANMSDAETHALEVFNDPVYADTEEVFIMSVDIINTTFKYVKNIENPSKGVNANNANKNIVTIVKDKGRLRAQADDGTHGKGFVSFPNNLRNAEGQQYEVETLVWTGKNYRASGKITPVATKLSNKFRYCVATTENPDLSDSEFVFAKVTSDPITGDSIIKFGIDTFWSLNNTADFDYDIEDAKDRVRDIMRQWPNEELHILAVDEQDNLETVLSFR